MTKLPEISIRCDGAVSQYFDDYLIELFHHIRNCKNDSKYETGCAIQDWTEEWANENAYSFVSTYMFSDILYVSYDSTICIYKELEEKWYITINLEIFYNVDDRVLE